MMVFNGGGRAALAATVGLAAALSAGVAFGQPAAPERAAVLRSLLDCRTVADDAARLACFDTAAGAFDRAEAQGDILVVDKEQATAVRRQAFGFTLPSLSVFERGDAESAKLDNISAQVVRATEDGAGRWTVELEGGAVWQQTDNERLARRPRAGSVAEIRTTAMGGYFMNLDGQRAVRARRVR